MANYATLKAAIATAIRENGNNEITGNLLQQQLFAMVNSLGVGYQYAGIATPATNPGTPDQNVFYIASEAGTYSNFSGIVVAENEVAILKWNGAWSKDSTGAASAAQLNQLGQKVDINQNTFEVVFNSVFNSDGKLVWLENRFYIARTGDLYDGTNLHYVCTLKYSKDVHDNLLDVIDTALASWDMTQLSFWKDGVYVGYRIQNGYHLPDGTSVTSIDFDTFAINVQSTQIPDYETKFIIVGNTEIEERLNVVERETGGNTQIIDSILSSGKLVWHDGAFYAASTGVIKTSIAAYSCSDKYPQHYYTYLSSRIEELFTASDWTQLSFWKDGVYVGYRIQNGYHLPNGTSVESIDYDEFAINLSNEAIPDYRTSVVFLNIRKVNAFVREFYALGDSTTAGAGSSQSPVKSWADYLTELATFPSFTKLAISGAFCLYHEGYGRLSAEIDSVPANTIGIVTIMIGTNDFFFDSPLGDAAAALAASYAELDDTTTFANAFRYCLDKLKRKAPNAVIIVMQPLPSFDAGNVQGHLDETNLFAIRDIERTICNAMGIPIVESQYIFGLSRYTGNWNTFYNDFCHPNDVGYQRIAHCMLGKFIEFCQ